MRPRRDDALGRQLTLALYAPAAGITRSFLCGCGLAGAFALLRVPARPGTGVLPVLVRPAVLGTACAGFCSIWHAARLALELLGVPHARRSAIAGAVAGSSLALARSDIAGSHTELHTSTALAALRALRRRQAPRDGGRGRLRDAAPVVLTSCAASWCLIAAHGSADPSVLPAGVRAWLAVLVLPGATQPAAAAGGGVLASRLASAFMHGWRRGFRAHLAAAAPVAVVMSVRRSRTSAGEVAAARTAAAEGQLHLRGEVGVPARSRPAAAAGRRLLSESARAGVTSGAFALALAGGPRTCAAAGWCAGLSVLALPSGAPRTELAARLAYQATLCAANAALPRLRAALRRGANGGGGGAAGSDERALAVFGALVLGASVAAILHEHATIAERLSAGVRSAARGDRTVRAVHFLLGYDEPKPNQA